MCESDSRKRGEVKGARGELAPAELTHYASRIKGFVMARKSKPIRSDIAWSTHDKIVVRAKNLPDEIIGHLNLGDFAYLQLTGKTPTAVQSRMFNAILVTLAEHGITPSAIVARMTYLGAPEAMQAAVAAGLCGLGTVFVGSMEGAARMLYQTMPAAAPRDLPAAVAAMVFSAHSHST